MAINTEQVSELLDIIGRQRTIWDIARARIIGGWEPLVNTTASKIIAKKLILRVTIANRIYGTHKTYIFPYFYY